VLVSWWIVDKNDWDFSKNRRDVLRLLLWGYHNLHRWQEMEWGFVWSVKCDASTWAV
jgi:hypothetical protein